MTDLINFGFQADTSDLERANRELNQFESAGKRAGTSTDKLGRSTDKLGRKASGLGGHLRSSERATRAMTGATRGATDAAQNYARRLGPVGEALAAIGPAGLAGAAGVGALAVVMTKAARVAIEFESGLASVGKTTDISGANLAQLGDRISKLSIRLGESSDGLLATAQAAGQLGVTGADNVLLFTETVTKLGTASDLSGEQAATALARLQSVTGESTDTVDTLASVIVSLGNNFAATESEIVHVAQRVAQASAIFGVSSAEATAFGAAMKQLGIRAEAGGTAIGRAFKTISDATTQGGEELQVLEDVMGQSGEAIQKAFGQDSTAAVVDFIDALGQLPAAEQSRAMEALGLNGERAFQVLTTLAGGSDELRSALGMANGELENATALEEEFARMLDTTAVQLGRVRAGASALMKEIGMPLAEAIGMSARELADFMETMDIGKVAKFIGIISDLAQAHRRFTGTFGIPEASSALRSFIADLEETDDSLQGVSPLMGDLATDAQKLDSALAGGASATDDLGQELDFLVGITGQAGEATGRYVETTKSASEAVEAFDGHLVGAISRLKESRALLQAMRTGGVEAYENVANAIDTGNELLELANELMEKGEKNRADAIRQASVIIANEKELNRALDEREERLDQIKDLQKIADEATKAAGDAQERQNERLAEQEEDRIEQLKRQQEAQEKALLEPILEAKRAIQSDLAGAFEELFSGQIDSFRDFFGSVVDIAKKAAAQVAAAFAMQSISIGPAQAAANVGSAFGGGGAAGGGGVGGMLSGASSLLSGAGGIAKSFLPGGVTPGAAIGGAFSSLNVGATNAIGNLGISSGLGPGLGNLLHSAGGVGTLGLGALGGGLVANLMGGSQVGGGIGGGIGSGLGFAVGGPLGAALGSALGGAVGGLFGDNKPNRAHAQFLTGGQGGGSFNNANFASSPFGNVGLANRTSDDIPGELSRGLADQIANVDQAVADMLSGDQLSRVSEAVQGSGSRVSLGRGATDTEAVGQLFAERFQKIFRAIDAQLPEFVRQAATAGGDVSRVIEESIDALQSQLRDRRQALERDLAEVQQQMAGIVNTLGARLQNIMGAQESLSGFIADLEDRQRTPEQRLRFARSQFEQTKTAAIGGDASAARDLVSQGQSLIRLVEQQFGADSDELERTIERVQTAAQAAQDVLSEQQEKIETALTDLGFELESGQERRAEQLDSMLDRLTTLNTQFEERSERLERFLAGDTSLGGDAGAGINAVGAEIASGNATSEQIEAGISGMREDMRNLLNGIRADRRDRTGT